MNGFDIALLAIACVLVVVGMIKGLVRVLLGLAALVAAFALAARFHRPLADRIGAANAPDEVLMLVAYVLIFIGVMLAGALLAYLARRLVKVAMLSWADRCAGAALGLVVAFLGAALLVLPVVAYAPGGGAILQESMLAPYVAAGADLAVTLVPADLSERYEQRMETLRRAWRGQWTDDAV